MVYCLKKILLKIILIFFLLIYPCNILAEQCFINNECFGVIEASMATRACHLFYYSTTINNKLQSDFIVINPNQYHNDPLQAEYLKLIIEKKILPLKKNTLVFNCHYSLEILINKPDKAEILGINTPKYNCFGKVYEYVPIRPISGGVCYWVPKINISCKKE